MSKRKPPNENEPNRSEPSLTVLKYLVIFIKSAGGKTEAMTKRDGFLSYHAETHAAGMGIAAGWFATAFGETKLLSLVYGAAVYGRAHAANGKRRRVIQDCTQEPHYTLGGAVLGGVLGTLTSALLRLSGVELSLLGAVPL